MIASHRGFRFAVLHALGAAHGRPVILVLGGAQQTDLVILSFRIAARPGELVRTSPEH
jgi:hypothetical protein